MKKATVLPVFLLLFASAQAQQATQTGNTGLSAADRIQVDQTLQRYAGAFAHKNFQDLLSVWPDLQNDKKEAGKIRHHFEDGNVSEEQMTVEPTETDPTGDGAIVRVQRTEQYVKTERTSSIAHGDLNMGNMPVQDPGPAQSEKKKPFKKNDTVWFKLHRAGDSWTVVSITSQKPQ